MPSLICKQRGNRLIATCGLLLQRGTSWARGAASGPGRVLPVVIVKWQRPSEARRTLPLPKVKLPRRSGAEPACKVHADLREV